MRILFYALVISLLSLPARSQIFFHTYGDTSHEQNKIHLTTSSGYYLFNTERNPVPYGQQEVIKVNPYGDSLQSWLLPPYIAGTYQAIVSITGNRFVGCKSFYNNNSGIDSIVVTWYDSSLQVISSVLIMDTVSIYIERILSTSDGNILLAGGDGIGYSPFTSYSRLMKLDSTGNMIFNLRLNPISYITQRAMGLIETSDHYYILATEISSGSNGASSKEIYKIDQSGNIIWSVPGYGYYAGFPNQLSELSNGYFYLENTAPNNHDDGFFRVSLLDTSGSTVWSRIIYNFYGIHAIGVGNSIYACGFVSINSYFYYNDIAILKMNDAGDSVTTFTIQLPKNETGDCISYSNNMLIVSGTIDDTIYTYHGNSFLMGIDTAFNATLFLKENNLLHNFYLYPNPATEQFTVRIPIAIGTQFAKNSHFEIFNSLGEEFYTADYRDPMTVDCGHFQRGIYFVRISNSERQLTQKLIIE